MSKSKKWMCELYTFSQIRSHIELDVPIGVQLPMMMLSLRYQLDVQILIVRLTLKYQLAVLMAQLTTVLAYQTINL